MKVVQKPLDIHYLEKIPTFFEALESINININNISYSNPENYYTLSTDFPEFYTCLWGDFNSDNLEDVLFTGSFGGKKGNFDAQRHSFIAMVTIIDDSISMAGYIEAEVNKKVISYTPDGLKNIFAIYYGQDDLWWVSWDGKELLPLEFEDY